MANQPVRTVVCVTGQRNCERLIREGALHGSGDDLLILHVAHPGQALMGFPTDPGALEYLYEIAREYRAEMRVIRAEDVVETIASVAEENLAGCVVMGAPGANRKNDYARALAARLPGVKLVVL